jgi:hypothetical protein
MASKRQRGIYSRCKSQGKSRNPRLCLSGCGWKLFSTRTNGVRSVRNPSSERGNAAGFTEFLSSESRQGQVRAPYLFSTPTHLPGFDPFANPGTATLNTSLSYSISIPVVRHGTTERTRLHTGRSLRTGMRQLFLSKSQIHAKAAGRAV